MKFGMEVGLAQKWEESESSLIELGSRRTKGRQVSPSIDAEYNELRGIHRVLRHSITHTHKK